MKKIMQRCLLVAVTLVISTQLLLSPQTASAESVYECNLDLGNIIRELPKEFQVDFSKFINVYPTNPTITYPDQQGHTSQEQQPETSQNQQPQAPQGEQNQAPQAEADNAWEMQVINLVNEERKQAGLQPLSYDGELTQVARYKSEDMRDKNYFDHQSPTYGSPFDMLSQFGVSYSYAGENIAAGQTSPESVVEGWMNSPGHRANILNPNYTKIGVGLAEGGSYNYYWTQIFTG